jgi:hypothetical protein
MTSEEFGRGDLLSRTRRFPEKALSNPFFLQLLEDIRTLNTRRAGRKSRWRQNEGDPK